MIKPDAGPASTTGVHRSEPPATVDEPGMPPRADGGARDRDDAADHGHVALGEMLEGVAILDDQLRYVYLNEAAARQAHAPADRLIGGTFADAFPGGVDSEPSRRWRTCLETGLPQRFTTRFDVPGRTSWFEFSAHRVPDGIFVLSLDVTERHLAEAAERARHDAEATLGVAVEHMPGILWILDRDLRFTASRGAALPHLGLAPDDLVGRHLYDFLGTSDPADTSVAAQIAALRGVPTTYEATFAGRRWTCTTEPLRGSGERVAGVIGVAIDITEQVALAEGARGAWATASAALDATEDSVVVYRVIRDAAGRFEDAEIAYLNETARRRWFAGETTEGLRGRRLFAEWPQVRGNVFDLYQQAADTGTTVRATRLYRTADGPLTIDVAVSPFEGGIVHVGRDVTDEQATKAALHASEVRLRRLVEGIDAIISYREPGAGPVILSPQVERILGRRPDEIAAYEVWQSLVHPEDLGPCLDAWLSGSAWDLEYRFRHADGRWIWLSDRGRRIVDERGTGSFSVLTDISERKRAELALRESEGRYRTLTDSASDAIVTTDETGRIVDANSSASRLFGWTRDALIGRPVADLIPADRRSAHVAHVQRMFDGDGTVRGLPTLLDGVRADGSSVPVEISLSRWSSDGRSFASAFIRDVSERLRAEAADARLRYLLDANMFGTLVAEPSGRVLEANDYWLALTGWTRAEFEAGLVDWRAVTTPESLEADDRAIAALRDLGTSQPFEKTYLRRDGVRVPVLVVRTAMPGEGDRIVSIVLDMTQLREASGRAVRLASAIEQTSDSVVIADLDGVIQYVNPAFERVTGYAAAEAVGRNPRLLQSGVHAAAFYEGLWGTLLRGETWQGELVNKRKDGSRFTEEASISPVRGADGAIVAYVAVKRDVTGQRDLEAQLQQSQRLEALGQLAGGVAHDFNNILAAIRGYGQFVLDDLPDGSGARADMLEVLRAAERASGLTRQLLVFSRRRPAAPQLIDPAAVIDEAVGMLHRLLGEEVALHTVLPHGIGNVEADPGELERAVVNLAVNARDAMPHGGMLEIRVESAETLGPVGSPPCRVVRLTFTDSGTGMDEATAARIFEPFFTTKEQGKGTGLGLAMVYGFVRSCDGSIAVHSVPGQGTTFTIDLPVAAGQASRAPGAASAALPRGTETILLVEDEAAPRIVAERMLSGLGYTVHAASGGAEALELVRSGRVEPDLLLTDIRMPLMQGPELAWLAARLRPGVAVLYMSAYADAEAITAEDPAGAAVLDKPFTREGLATAVRAALDARTGADGG